MKIFVRTQETLVEHWFFDQPQKALYVHGLPSVGKKTFVMSKLKELAHIIEFDCRDKRVLGAGKLVNPLPTLERLAGNTHDAVWVFLFADECPWLIEITKTLLSAGKRIVLVFDSYDKTLSESRFFPLGYATEIRVDPLSFTEYCLAHGVAQKDILRYCESVRSGSILSEGVFQRFQQLWDRYLFVGGFPSVIDADDSGDWARRELTLLNIERDVDSYIRECYGKKARTVYASIGQARSGYFDRFVPSRASKGGTSQAYREPIETLASKDLITAVPYFEKGIQTVDYSLYHIDSGLMRAFLGIRGEEELNGQGYHYLEMGALSRALKHRGFLLRKEHAYGYSPDLICQKGQDEFAIEVKSARGIRLRIDKALSYLNGRGLFVLSPNNAISSMEGRRILPTCMFALMAESDLL